MSNLLRSVLLCGPLFCVLMLISACKKYDSIIGDMTDAQFSVVRSNSALAIDIYQQLRKQPGNLFFSPYSVSASMAMAYAGARGQTKDEMIKALHFDSDEKKLHSAFKDLSSSIKENQRHDATLIVAKSLWYQQGNQLATAFLDLVRNQYNADVHQVDFKKNPATASDKINGWFNLNTNGKIKTFSTPNEITSDTRLLLCDAIYFKARWENRFNIKETAPLPFLAAVDESVNVPMMRQSAKFKMAYIDDQDLEILELPYAGNTLSMVVLLPAVVDGLTKIEEQLTQANLQRWVEKLIESEEREIFVSLPRLQFTQKLNLTKTLEALGVSSLFDEKDSDLSGMTGGRDFYVSGINQTAAIEVDEQGAEAVAATQVTIKTKAKPLSFTANHPFIFFIRENRTGSILFIGRMVNPMNG